MSWTLLRSSSRVGIFAFIVMSVSALRAWGPYSTIRVKHVGRCRGCCLCWGWSQLVYRCFTSNTAAHCRQSRTRARYPIPRVSIWLPLTLIGCELFGPFGAPRICLVSWTSSEQLQQSRLLRRDLCVRQREHGVGEHLHRRRARHEQPVGNFSQVWRDAFLGAGRHVCYLVSLFIR